MAEEKLARCVSAEALDGDGTMTALMPDSSHSVRMRGLQTLVHEADCMGWQLHVHVRWMFLS